MTNFEKYFPGRTIDEFKGMTGLATNNKIRDCDHCPAEKMCAADKQGHTCWGIFVKWAKTKIKPEDVQQKYEKCLNEWRMKNGNGTRI